MKNCFRFVRLITIAVVVYIASNFALSQPDFWQHSLPTGDLYGFTVAQTEVALLSPDNFIYSSTDEGQTWQAMAQVQFTSVKKMIVVK